jgi:hypothetical protein
MAAGKSNDMEYVLRVVDEWSKSISDFRNAVKGMAQDSDTTAKSVSSLGDRLMGFGNILKGAMLQAGADIFEALKNGFESLIQLIPQAYEAGYNWVEVVRQMQLETGMGAQDVSTLAAVMREVGISTDDTGSILAKFSKNLVDSEDKFKALGIATRDSNGILLSADQVLENTRQRVQQLGPSFMATTAAQDLFGKAGYQMLDLLQLTDAQFKELAASAGAAGMVLDQSTIDAAHRFGIEMGDLNNTITGLQTSIFAGLEPSFEHFVDSFASFIQAHMQQIVGFVVSIANFVMGVLAGLFGMNMDASTLAGGIVGGEGGTGGAGEPPKAPTPPTSSSGGGGGGSAGTDKETLVRQARIKEIDDEIAAIQALDAAQNAEQHEADLQQAIADAQQQLTDLQSSVLNTYGLSDAERIKAEQKRTADTTAAEKKVADTQKTYSDYQTQEARQAQIKQLQDLRDSIQVQAQTRSAGVAGESAAWKKYYADLAAYKKAYDDWLFAQQVAGFTSLDDAVRNWRGGADEYSQDAKDALADGKKFSDWIKTTLVPALQDTWHFFEGVHDVLVTLANVTNDWIIKPLQTLNNLLSPVGGLAFVLAALVTGGPAGPVLVAVIANFTTIKDVIGDLVKKLQDLGSPLKSFVDTLSKLKLPDLSGLIPHFALGGIATGPTLAMVGEGRESEHIIPTSMLQQALNSMAAAGASVGGGSVIMVDKRVLGQVIDELMAGKLPAGYARLNA